MTRSRHFALCLLTVVVACGGAASNIVKPGLVQTTASTDFNCPKDQVTVEHVTDTRWKASGCGREASYVCWTSVGMGDGTCTRDQ